MSTITGPLTSYPAMKGAIDFYTTGTGITVSQVCRLPKIVLVCPYSSLIRVHPPALTRLAKMNAGFVSRRLH